VKLCANSLSHPKRRGDQPERYSYADLGVDQLGSVYEGLLVYEPSIAEQTMVEAHLKGEIRLIPQDQADELELRYDEETRKPAGSFLLRIWGGRRKGSGSYYTPQEITAFLVKDALAPLVEPIIGGCAQRNEDGNPVRRADEILHIKICDPAMGSGAFLVQACRYLGEAYGRAIIAEEQRENTRVSTTELAKYKRRVAEKCLYGVDLNPLAVELAKVSLWLETLAQDRPLTFLDAHLRCGNALIGAPLRNAEGKLDSSLISILPVDAYTKVNNIDSKLYGQQLDKLKAENGKQVKQFVGKAKQLSLFSIDEEQDALIEYERQRLQLEESDEDKSLEDAVALIHRKHAMLQEAFLGDASKIRAFKELCDLWCAVWFWPVDAAILPPSTILYHDLAGILLKRPIQYVQSNADEYFRMAKEIAQRQRFFHWELEFPEVWCDKAGKFQSDRGFDIIVGNPPWSKVAPNSKEFWANYLPTYPALTKQDADRASEELRSTNPKTDMSWKKYFKYIKQESSLFKQESLFLLQGTGSLDTYKLFIEQMLRLSKKKGICSLVLPGSMYTDKGCTDLRYQLFFRHKTRFLVSIENREKFFPIDSRKKFVLFSVEKAKILEVKAQRGDNTIDSPAIGCLFLGGKTCDGHNIAPSMKELGMLLPQLDRHLLQLPANIIKTLAPQTLSLMEFKGQNEIDLVLKMYALFPLMGQSLEGNWNVSFVNGELHMTGDSHLFRGEKRLKQFNAVEQAGRIWKTPPESWYKERSDRYIQGARTVINGKAYFASEADTKKTKYIQEGYLLKEEINNRQALPIIPDTIYVPLYEGRMVHQFDHAAKAYESGSGRSAEWNSLSFDQKEVIPHYFVAQQNWNHLAFRAGFCDVTGPTNERSILAAIIPPTYPCGHTVSTVVAHPETINVHLLWVALVNSFVVDWLTRLRVSNHVGFFLLETLPIPRIKLESQEAQQIIHLTARLTCTTFEFATLWENILGETWQTANVVKDTRKRAWLQAEIDAAVADLYQLSEHDFAYILNTFPLLDRDQPHLLGDTCSFITRDMALLALFKRRGKIPPENIINFFNDAGMDICPFTGEFKNLEERVRIATQELGAVAYQPSRRDKEENNGDGERAEQDELDFYDEE
jgi:N-6 DNA Methylase